MSGIRILLAEDDVNLNKIITRYLEKEGYQVFSAANGDDALDIWFDQSIDLSILDVMMPGMDGWELLEEIRRDSENPVIMLTARRDEEDRLHGFELGTDDYITKPFSSRELLMRVKALLKRSGRLSQKDVVELPGIKLDNKAKSIRTSDGEAELSAREYELMVYFIDNRGQALTRMQLLDRIWGYEYTGDTRVLDTTIKRLRKKLGDCGDCIRTIRGIGYKFEVNE
ncbi:MAG TPA: response regulator transcription factor [Clostridia bacterium]|nr:response regulator transcription factor [Clostridia bacterium]HPQ47744.1 response regulator transcription factor [Clostridia bacterium]